MRPENMLDVFGVTEETWRGALEREPHLVISGSQPDCWRYMVEVMDAGKPADPRGYR